MAIYSVHIPADGADPVSAAERARFVREGFSWAALLFGPLWLLARRLWRPLAIWCVVALFVGVAIGDGRLGESAAGWLYFAAALFLGFEGRGLVGAAMERRGLPLVDVAAGSDLIAAENGFFSRWLADAPSPAPIRAPARSNRPAADAHVIGMFPEAGG